MAASSAKIPAADPSAMPAADPSGIPANDSSIIPGTILPLPVQTAASPPPNEEALSTPGPTINGNPTTITLTSPAHIAHSPFFPSLRAMVNTSFRIANTAERVLPASLERVQSPADLLAQLGTSPSTFTYLVHGAGTADVLATASMWRLSDAAAVVVADPNPHEPPTRSDVFRRRLPVPPGVEAWELKLMGVHVAAQRQGLAALLMPLCEAEARRRFAAARAEAVAQGRRPRAELMFVLTTLLDGNEGMYRRNGFVRDDERWFPPGFMGSEGGMTVRYMSKRVDVSGVA